MSWFMWIIVLIIAFSQYERGIKLLDSFKPQVQKLLPSSANNEIQVIGALKSENPIKSNFDEQQLLQTLERQLISNVLIKNNNPSESNSRWNAAEYQPVTGLSDSAFYEASRLIFCSNDLNNSLPLCENITELLKKSLYGVKMEKRLVFAFRMRLETTPMSATLFRIKLHEYFRKHLWPVLCKRIDFVNETREIIFVGYESGGSLASLAAWMTIKQFESTKPAGVFIKNGNNQVKAITWDELPLFTHETASKSPLMPCNHSRFSSISIGESIYRQIAQSSSGIDEINYFSTSGDLIPIKSTDYTEFSARFDAIEAAKKCQSNEIECNSSSFDIVKFIKSKHLNELDENRLKKLSSILLLHRKHLSILHHLISTNYRSYLVNELLSEPNSIATTLANQLSNTIFPGSTITCRIHNFNTRMGTFKIYCSYLVSSVNKTWSQIFSFEAILGDEEAHTNGNDCLPFTEEVEIPTEIPDGGKSKGKNPSKSKSKDKDKKVKTKSETVYTVPVPDITNWSNCIDKLFQGQSHLSLLSPFVISKQKILPHCSYIAFPSDAPLNFKNHLSNKRNTGGYVVAPNISTELLQLYKSDPNVFYRLVNPKLMEFPTSCKRQLFNIPFVASERVGLEGLQQDSVEYLTQIVSRNPMVDSEVTLWRQMDTESYNTLSFLGTNTISLRILVNQINYEPEFDNSIIKCLSNLSYPYRDCTNPINRWIKGACPVACEQTHGSIDFLCKQVKSCPSAGYYISISKEGSLQQVTHIHEQLTKIPNPQFGIFHVQKKGWEQVPYFGYPTFNVALFRIPSDQS